MNFLCPKHRLFLTTNPSKAIPVWHRTMLQAQDAVRHEDWSDAIQLYGNAVDIADILVEKESFSERALVRYSHSALEFAYVLVRTGIGISELIGCVQMRLGERQLPDPACHLVNILRSLTQRKTTAINTQALTIPRALH